MKRIALFFTISIFQSIFSQEIRYQYPDGQFAYQGGSKQMFSEMQDFFLKSGAKPCEKNEKYFVTLKVNENGKPALIKHKGDEANIAQNKCAFDLAVKSLGSLKNWQPAEENGKKISAYFDFPFIPKDFFENYQPDYNLLKVYQSSELPGGMPAFRRDVIKNLEAYADIESYRPKGKFIIFFDVDIDGKVTNIDMEPKVANYERLLDDVKFAIKKVKGQWSPSKVKGVPVTSKFRMPISFTSRD